MLRHLTLIFAIAATYSSSNCLAQEKGGHKLIEAGGGIHLLIFDDTPFDEALRLFSHHLKRDIQVAPASAKFASRLKAYISITDSTWMGGLKVLAISYGFRVHETPDSITLYYTGPGPPPGYGPGER